jgi:hypothetical protein
MVHAEFPWYGYHSLQCCQRTSALSFLLVVYYYYYIKNKKEKTCTLIDVAIIISLVTGLFFLAILLNHQ